MARVCISVPDQLRREMDEVEKVSGNVNWSEACREGIERAIARIRQPSVWNGGPTDVIGAAG